MRYMTSIVLKAPLNINQAIIIRLLKWKAL